MDKNYYEVYISDNGITCSYPLICQCLGKVDTRNFGHARIFREIITNRIIRPKYDVRIEEMQNDDMGTLIYDNLDEKSFQKISGKKVLTTLKNLSQNDIDMYLKYIEEIETKQIEIVLTRVRKEDICYA